MAKAVEVVLLELRARCEKDLLAVNSARAAHGLAKLPQLDPRGTLADLLDWTIPRPRNISSMVTPRRILEIADSSRYAMDQKNLHDRSLRAVCRGLEDLGLLRFCGAYWGRLEYRRPD